MGTSTVTVTSDRQCYDVAYRCQTSDSRMPVPVAVRFFKLVSFVEGVWFVDVQSVGLPTRLTQALATLEA